MFQDNHASQGVSRKLGYEPDGISVDARGQRGRRVRPAALTREKWRRLDHPAVTVDGLAACRSMFEVVVDQAYELMP